MKQLMQSMFWALLLSQAGVLAQQQKEPPPEKWPFDPKGTRLMSDVQVACAVAKGVPHCPIVVTEKAKISALAADTITFHNDTVAMIDNSDELQLRKMLISKTNSIDQFQQHTHGENHVLFVATRDKWHGASLKRYKLDETDTVEVYMGAINQSITESAIRDGKLTPGLKITIANTDQLEDLDCPHPAASLKWWYVTPSGMTWSSPDPEFKPDPDVDKDDPNYDKMIIASYLTKTETFLRWMVVKNASGGIRYSIPLKSGCSSFKLCTHQTAVLPPPTSTPCDGVSLCLLDRDLMLPRANPNCKNCRWWAWWR